MSKTIVLATGNKGKVTELRNMLAPFNIDIKPQSDWQLPDAEETGTTFVENAIIKARHAAQATGFPCIADDSGLVVNSLQGAPGIYSARYAGEHATDQDNIDKLLTQMEHIPQGQRQARFVCVLVYLRHANDPLPIICQGSWHGQIMQAQMGENGFGYDPVFWVETHQCSSAQLSKQEKNHLSHRGQALAQMMAHLESLSE